MNLRTKSKEDSFVSALLSDHQDSFEAASMVTFLNSPHLSPGHTQTHTRAFGSYYSPGPACAKATLSTFHPPNIPAPLENAAVHYTTPMKRHDNLDEMLGRTLGSDIRIFEGSEKGVLCAHVPSRPKLCGFGVMLRYGRAFLAAERRVQINFDSAGPLCTME